YGHVNVFASVMILPLVTLIFLWAGRRTRLLQSPFLYLIGFLTWIAVVLSFSRASYVSLIISAGFGLFLYFSKQRLHITVPLKRIFLILLLTILVVSPLFI